jgi:hypothetical protein
VAAGPRDGNQQRVVRDANIAHSYRSAVANEEKRIVPRRSRCGRYSRAWIRPKYQWPDPGRAHRYRPWSRPKFNDLPLEALLASEEDFQLLLRTKVLLRADPDRGRSRQ